MSSGDPRYRNKSAEKNNNDFWKVDIKENFRTMLEENEWRMRSNVELEKLYKDVNIPTFIKLQRDIQNGWMVQENA